MQVRIVFIETVRLITNVRTNTTGCKETAKYTEDPALNLKQILPKA